MKFRFPLIAPSCVPATLPALYRLFKGSASIYGVSPGTIQMTDSSPSPNENEFDDELRTAWQRTPGGSVAGRLKR